MNSPSAMARSMSRSAWSAWNCLSRCATASFAAPWDEAIISCSSRQFGLLLEPREARGHGDAGAGQHHHRGKEVGHVEAVGRLADELAEAGARAEELGDDDADEAAADAELQPR